MSEALSVTKAQWLQRSLSQPVQPFKRLGTGGSKEFGKELPKKVYNKLDLGFLPRL